MIIKVDEEVARLREALASGNDMALAAEVVKILDRGMAMERARCIAIIQAKAIRPMDIIREIRKPLR